MNRQLRDKCADIKLKKVVSVLPNDYSQLENLPRINGVTLSGDISSKELNLLSSSDAEYETIKLSNLTGKGMYVPVIGDDETSCKVPVDDFWEESKVKVTDTLDEDVSVGTIQLVKIKAIGG